MGACVVFASCKKEVLTTEQSQSPALLDAPSQASNATKTNTFKGPEVRMGDGKARSFAVITHAGVPLEVGIEMTPGAFEGLTQDPLDFAAATFVLPLHHKAQDATPFDHLVINWEPHGHDPVHVFDVPHFDFHFYMISMAEQNSIPPYDVAPSLFDNFPPAGYLPANYIPFPGGVPQMGKHWGDITSPEFNGQPFTKTFIYGTYNGRVTFYEPMVAKSYLQTVGSTSAPIPQPLHYSPTGTYYPTVYKIYHDESGNTIISLSGFVLR